MSVKRFQMQEAPYGPFVSYSSCFELENDYATLEARHNALREAVDAARTQVQMMCRELSRVLGDVNISLLMEDLAEVDRLLEDK